MSRVTGAYCLMQASALGVNACLYCYNSVFLLSHGLSNSAIGAVLALACGASFLGQILFGALLNRRGRSGLRRFLLAAAGILLAEELALLLPIGRLPAVAVFLSACVLLNLFPTFLDAASVYELRRGVPVDFGIGRGAGSLGYAASSALVGQRLLVSGTDAIFRIGTVLSVITVASIFWFFFETGRSVPADSSDTPAPQDEPAPSRKLDMTFLTTYPRYAMVLLGCTLLIMGQTSTTNFWYQVVCAKGGDERGMGLAVAAAACMEVPVLFLFSRFSHKLRSDQWLKLSAVVMSIKAVTVLLAGGMPSFLFAQLFQTGYALYLVGSVCYTDVAIPHRDLISGQAYIHAAATLGSLLSLLIGGVILDYFGVTVLLLVGAATLLCGSAIVFRFALPARLAQKR